MAKGRWYQKQEKESCFSCIVVLKSRWNFSTINKIKLSFPFLYCRNSLSVFFGYLVIVIIIHEKEAFEHNVYFFHWMVCITMFFLNFSQTVDTS